MALGTLAGRVGASLLASRVADLARDPDARAAHRAELLVRNATKVVETLGRLKGGAMKVGQMLSLHAELLPPGVAEVLSSLQQSAPSVPSEVMEGEARFALRNFDDLFATFDPTPFASASIGQVHGATLRDGRRVAVKIQYPRLTRSSAPTCRTCACWRAACSACSQKPTSPRLGGDPRPPVRGTRLHARGGVAAPRGGAPRATCPRSSSRRSWTRRRRGTSSPWSTSQASRPTKRAPIAIRSHCATAGASSCSSGCSADSSSTGCCTPIRTSRTSPSATTAASSSTTWAA